MKKVSGLVIVVLFVALVLISGCIDGDKDQKESSNDVVVPEEETSAETTIKTSCNDDNPCTQDTYNSLTNECEYRELESCCGNNICEPGERCNEKTHLTNCIEDCSRTCPAHLIVHGEENEGVTNPISLNCADNNCEKINDIKFRTTGSSSLKATITNIGESTSSMVFSNFMCWSGEEQASVDGRSIYGVVFKDYFNDNENEINDINAIQSKNNFATYYLSFDLDNLEKPFLANCVVRIRSTDLDYKQTVTVSFN